MSEANNQLTNECEKIVHEKSCAIMDILDGLNVYQAKQIIMKLNYSIEASSIIGSRFGKKD